MNEETRMEKLIKEYSIELNDLEKQRDDIINKITELAYKKDILKKAREVMQSNVLKLKPFASIKLVSPVKSKPKAARGLKAATFEILSVDKYLSVHEIQEALLAKEISVKIRNIYIMLYRAENDGKLKSITEGGKKKYALAA